MRTINKIIIHSTATPEGRNHTAAEICQWHRNAGKREVGYHYVVGIGGTIENGRSSATAGAHAVGHNANSIGIAYVGGTDRAGQPKDTRTPEQKEAMINLIAELRKEFPNAEVIGHRDVGSTACPSFDAKKEYSV